MIFGVILLFGTVFGLMLIAFEDGVSFSIIKKTRCKIGWHKIHNKIGKVKVHRYYCKFCKKPREHPVLKIVDGGNKLRDDKFKF